MSVDCAIKSTNPLGSKRAIWLPVLSPMKSSCIHFCMQGQPQLLNAQHSLQLALPWPSPIMELRALYQAAMQGCVLSRTSIRTVPATGNSTQERHAAMSSINCKLQIGTHNTFKACRTMVWSSSLRKRLGHKYGQIAHDIAYCFPHTQT